ncbi:MAG: GNAT family N-acetyltransferase [Nocardioidaceae bacterium]
MKAEVKPLREVTPGTVQELDGLLGQLSSTAGHVDRDQLVKVIECPTNTVLVARYADAMVGMLTLVVFPIPSGVRAWIEDLVVAAEVRGEGIGAALMLEAVRRARAAGARSVDLTSRPSRAAANRLYERLGFEERDSKVYRLP